MRAEAQAHVDTINEALALLRRSLDWDRALRRLDELNARVEDPTLWNDPKAAQDVMRERRRLDEAITATRTIIDAILDGSVEKAEFRTMPVFNFDVPVSLNGVDSKVLDPRETWPDKAAYDAGLRKLGQMFVDNFKKFTGTPSGKAVEAFGPKL